MRDNLWPSFLTASAFLVLIALIGAYVAGQLQPAPAADVPSGAVHALHRELGPEGFLGGLRLVTQEPQAAALDTLKGHLHRADIHRAAIVSADVPDAASDLRDRAAWLIGLYSDMLARAAATDGEAADQSMATAIAAYGLLRSATPSDWMVGTPPPPPQPPLPATAIAVVLSALLLAAAFRLRRRQARDLKRLTDAATDLADGTPLEPLRLTRDGSPLDRLAFALERLATAQDRKAAGGTALATLAAVAPATDDGDDGDDGDAVRTTLPSVPTLGAVSAMGREPDWDSLVAAPLNQALGRIHHMEVQYGRMWEQAFRLLSETSGRLGGTLDQTELTVGQFERRLQGLEETYGRVLRTVSASAEDLPERLTSVVRNLERRGEDLTVFLQAIKGRWEAPIGLAQETGENLGRLHDRMKQSFEQSILENRQLQLHLAGALRVIDGGGRMLQQQTHTAADLLTGLVGLRDQLTGHVGTVQRHGDTLRAAVERLGTIEGPGERLAALKQGIDRLGEVVAALDRDLRQRAADIGDSLACVDSAAGAAADGLDGLSRGMSGLVGKVEAADRQIGDILDSLDRTNGAAQAGAAAVEGLCLTVERAGTDLARLGDDLSACLGEVSAFRDLTGDVGTALALVPAQLASVGSAQDLRPDVERILNLLEGTAATGGTLQEGVLRLSEQVDAMAGTLYLQQDRLSAIDDRGRGVERLLLDTGAAGTDRLEGALSQLDAALRTGLEAGAGNLKAVLLEGLQRLEALLIELSTTAREVAARHADSHAAPGPDPLDAGELLELKVQVGMMRERLEEVGGNVMGWLAEAGTKAAAAEASMPPAELSGPLIERQLRDLDKRIATDVAHGVAAEVERLHARLVDFFGRPAAQLADIHMQGRTVLETLRQGPELERILRSQGEHLHDLIDLVRIVVARVASLEPGTGVPLDPEGLSRQVADRVEQVLSTWAAHALSAPEPGHAAGSVDDAAEAIVARVATSLTDVERRLLQAGENLVSLQDGLRGQSRDTERTLQAARHALMDAAAGMESRGTQLAERIDEGAAAQAAWTDRLARTIAGLDGQLSGWTERLTALPQPSAPSLSEPDPTGQAGGEETLAVLDRLAHRLAHLTVELAREVATGPLGPTSADRLALLERTTVSLNTAATALAVYSDAQIA